MSPQILVVDDDRETLRLVRAYLEESNYAVLVAHDGETALQILRRKRPDLMLLDLLLPKGNGEGVSHVVRGNADLAAMPIILLGARAEDNRSGQMQDDGWSVAGQRPSAGAALGADEAGAEAFDPGEIVARVRAVLHRVQGEAAPPQVIQVQALRLDLDARQVEVRGRSVHLTPTEFGLLRALAEQPGHALTRQEMLERGLGYSHAGVERTVDSHIKNLRRKLDEAGEAAHLVQTVFGVGYRLAAAGRT